MYMQVTGSWRRVESILWAEPALKKINSQFRVSVGSRSCREIQQKIRKETTRIKRDQPYLKSSCKKRRPWDKTQDHLRNQTDRL